jgi:hypothetical protein
MTADLRVALGKHFPSGIHHHRVDFIVTGRGF